MAESPAHRLGQIIGDLLEEAIRKPLQEIAGEYGLYLDYKHPRPARGNKSIVAWQDSRGNTHNLDYVLEEGGSEQTIGRPRAFIESAWRRYTKHSRNKAQEIQGAIAPLAETYQDRHPFLGAVLGGVFTEGSLAQFRSHRFSVVYCPYESVLEAFASEGVDVSTDERTSDIAMQRKVDALERLTPAQRERIADEIRWRHGDQFGSFFHELRTSLSRRIERVLVLALSGPSLQLGSLQEAVRFVEGHIESAPATRFERYELVVRYTNGDDIRGVFREKARAIEFLRSFGV